MSGARGRKKTKIATFCGLSCNSLWADEWREQVARVSKVQNDAIGGQAWTTT